MFNLLSFVRQNYKILAYIHNITIEKYKIINNPLSSKLELKSKIILFFLHIAALTSAKNNAIEHFCTCFNFAKKNY